MNDPEDNNVNVTLDYVFRDLGSRALVTDSETGIERLFFSHEPSGFRARVIITPKNNVYLARVHASMDNKKITYREMISMNRHGRFGYACEKLRDAFSFLYATETD